MKILVDADACPVRKIIVSVAKEYDLDVIMFTDTSHILADDDYFKAVLVDKAKDSVDIALINNTDEGDIVITQDYGLAAMALAKGAAAIHHNGWFYNESNIDIILFERHIRAKARRAGEKNNSNKKRSRENDLKFETCLRKIIKEKIKEIHNS
ncbi:MAG: YaiI/YqxD family protein [Clostridiales bacterium]|nr:YaiI/YqxD family protein [Clostridiales bacterium]